MRDATIGTIEKVFEGWGDGEGHALGFAVWAADNPAEVLNALAQMGGPDWTQLVDDVLYTARQWAMTQAEDWRIPKAAAVEYLRAHRGVLFGVLEAIDD